MNIIKINLDGTNQTSEEAPAFADPGSAQAYLDYAQSQSEGRLAVIGEGFDNPPTRKTITAIAINGQIVVNNLVLE